MALTFILLFAVLRILSHFSPLPFIFSGSLTRDAAAIRLVALESNIFGLLLVATLTDECFCHGCTLGFDESALVFGRKIPH
jgi:hypothetical protein